MDAELKAKWVKALRSGDYKQGRGCLRSDGNFCCLGVLADIAGLEFENHPIANCIVVDGEQVGYRPIVELVGRDDLSPLWFRNDGAHQHEPHSFDEIADYIETHL